MRLSRKVTAALVVLLTTQALVMLWVLTRHTHEESTSTRPSSASTVPQALEASLMQAALHEKKAAVAAKPPLRPPPLPAPPPQPPPPPPVPRSPPPPRPPRFKHVINRTEALAYVARMRKRKELAEAAKRASRSPPPPKPPPPTPSSSPPSALKAASTTRVPKYTKWHRRPRVIRPSPPPPPSSINATPPPPQPILLPLTNASNATTAAVAPIIATTSNASLLTIPNESSLLVTASANESSLLVSSANATAIDPAPGFIEDPTLRAELPALLNRYWSAIHTHAQRLGLNVSQQRARTGKERVGTAAWWRRCRRFAVGGRHDYQGSIRDALKALKLCETQTAHWEVYWGDQWLEDDEFTKGSIRPNALANSIPGFRSSFGDKVAFAKLHNDCLHTRDEHLERRANGGDGEGEGDINASASPTGPPLFCSWTKRGFSIERSGSSIDGPVEAFRRHAHVLAISRGGDRNEFPQLWILKPQQGFNQMGISMVYLEAADLSSAQACNRPISPP